MFGPPQLWDYVTQHYLSLSPDLAWTWWRAVIRAKWRMSGEWRDEFLHLSRLHAVLTRNEVPAYLGGLTTLPRLVALIEALVSERLLARRDAKAIEEHLFTQADADGQWINERRP